MCSFSWISSLGGQRDYDLPTLDLPEQGELEAMCDTYYGPGSGALAEQENTTQGLEAEEA